MRCPGQDTQYWKPGAIFEAKCPECGQAVEFFKDDTTRKCPRCGHRFVNPKMDFGCAAYCQFAEQCLGDLPPELLAQKEDLLKDRVAIEVKRHYKRDFARIGRAVRAARYAERIGPRQGGNPAVILSAAYLHGIDRSDKIGDAQRPAAGDVGGDDGGSAARAILIKLGAPEALVTQVGEIVAALHDPGPNADVNLKTVHDAVAIARWEDELKQEPIERRRLERRITEHLLSPGGREEARRVLMEQTGDGCTTTVDRRTAERR